VINAIIRYGVGIMIRKPVNAICLAIPVAMEIIIIMPPVKTVYGFVQQ
jgi:hypothetical protein